MHSILSFISAVSLSLSPQVQSLCFDQTGTYLAVAGTDIQLVQQAPSPSVDVASCDHVIHLSLSLLLAECICASNGICCRPSQVGIDNNSYRRYMYIGDYIYAVDGICTVGSLLYVQIMQESRLASGLGRTHRFSCPLEWTAASNTMERNRDIHHLSRIFLYMYTTLYLAVCGTEISLSLL